MSSRRTDALPTSPPEPKEIAGKQGRIYVEETVPEQCREYKLESWYSMVRSTAFNELWHRLEAGKAFSLQCEMRQEWRETVLNSATKSTRSSRSLVVICEINYNTEE